MKISYSIFSLLLLSFSISTQEISGIILTQNNEPVIGAYVQHVESKVHTHSNDLGILFSELHWNFVIENLFNQQWNET